jgi:hypothetical protein
MFHCKFRKNYAISSGWGTWIRTKINGVRVRCPALISKGFIVKNFILPICNFNGLETNCKNKRPGIHAVRKIDYLTGCAAEKTPVNLASL